VLDALVDRQDGDVPRAAEAAVVVQRLQVALHLGRPVGEREHPLDVVGTRQMQVVAGDPLRLVGEQALGLVPQQALDVHHGPRSLYVGVQAQASGRPFARPPPQDKLKVTSCFA
jgi:hypothetical protein